MGQVHDNPVHSLRGVRDRAVGEMITPGGNPYCKHCGDLMHPGRNICRSGWCMCGESTEPHYITDNMVPHSPVDSAEYMEWECEADA